ncbi:guanylate kinase [Sphingobacteriales bacterium UPWRP_1]|nr:guanylate kinase [Sphingobacteriales bacterium TSM_CSS]PSJ75314.1 guanylate kinase [Sphingobacteriales bacterium UPWRP_1]
MTETPALPTNPSGNGKLVVFAAPSGAGKTTLVRHVLAVLGNHIAFSVSATTRKQRASEINGKDYYFISHAEFVQKINNNEFLEWQEVYDGNFYGTLKSEIERIWQQGKAVIFDVDVEGAFNIKNIYPHNTLTVFVKPPSIKAIRERLIGRNSETNEMLEKRIEKAVFELQYETRFDIVLLNDKIDEAKAKATEIVSGFLQRKPEMP